MSAISEIGWVWEPPRAEFNSFFDQAPVGLAQCRLSGQVIATNPALQRILHLPLQSRGKLTLVDLIEAQDSREAERELLTLLDGKRDTVQLDCKAYEPWLHTLDPVESSGAKRRGRVRVGHG